MVLSSGSHKWVEGALPREMDVCGWRGQQDLAGWSTASSTHLSSGELPEVLLGHRMLSPDAWLMLRPTPHFPGGKTGSERSKAYAC